MKNKRSLCFFVVTLVLVISMFGNVFAGGSSGWILISEHGTSYQSGDRLNYASDLYFFTVYPSNAECICESNFDVSAGDNIRLDFEAYLYGNETDVDGAASICSASLIAENGTELAEVRFELHGSKISAYGNDTIRITNATAGKLKLYVFLEGTGKSGVEARVDNVCVYVNGDEV